MGEARNSLEGSLRWVQASGSGRSWQTASAAPTGLLGFVTNLTYDSAHDLQVIKDRGRVSHHKLVAENEVTFTFDLQFANTGEFPNPLTASGTTTPMLHYELRMSAAELGAASAIYAQFYGVAVRGVSFSETTPANTLRYTCAALGMSAWNATGYLG